MKVKDLLKEKTNCYATDKVDTCKQKNCRFYWNCIAYRRQLENHEFESREIILEMECR